MIICADCRSEIQQSRTCPNCGWQVRKIDGFDEYLSTLNRKDQAFAVYRQNYNQIATQDLQHSIQAPEYLESQTLKLAKWIKGKNPGAALEIGVGQGILAKLLSAAGHAVTVIDIAVPYLSKLRQELKCSCVIANAENLPFKEEFDLITSVDVLEHVFQMGDFLYSVNHALKPAGRFVLRVPLNENLMPYSRLMGCPFEFVHLRSFTEEIITKNLTAAGFNILACRRDGFQFNYPRSYLNFLPAKLRTLFLRKVYAVMCLLLGVKRNNFLNLNFLPEGLVSLFWEPHEIRVLAQKEFSLHASLLNAQQFSRAK